MSVTMSPLPLSTRLRSPFVSVSSIRVTIMSFPIMVRAFVDPRPVYSRVQCTTAFEMASACCHQECSSGEQPFWTPSGRRCHAQGGGGGRTRRATLKNASTVVNPDDRFREARVVSMRKPVFFTLRHVAVLGVVSHAATPSPCRQVGLGVGIWFRDSLRGFSERFGREQSRLPFSGLWHDRPLTGI